jgi:hypothetical protein
MNCTETRPQLPLLLYGELSFDEEEAVEAHLDECAECRTALDRERELSAAFDQVAVEPSPVLLRQCRENLFTKLASEPIPSGAPVAARANWWERLVESISIPIPRPAGALALLLVGFFGARFVPPGLTGSLGSMGVAEFSPERVRAINPGPDGTVRIVFNETRERTVNGRADDANIQALLISAAKDPSDQLRIDTMPLLAPQAHATEVRNALVYAMRSDRNAGVRLRALKGLKPFLGETEVRNALADVLAADSNQAMRVQAIEMLVQSLDQAETAPHVVDPRMVGVLQELITSENENPYLREQSERALELVKASAEVF